jgi:hypothetical protein
MAGELARVGCDSEPVADKNVRAPGALLKELLVDNLGLPLKLQGLTKRERGP